MSSPTVESATMRLDFDDAAHAYRINGLPAPSVTQVIRDVLPGWAADDWYLQRGRALHHGCRLLDEGRLDWSSVSTEIISRVLAWQRFRAEFPADLVQCETPMGHPLYRYAGTPDRLLMNGVPIVADLKSSVSPQVRVQLGGYSLLFRAHGRAPQKGVAVELRDDGSYRTLWMDKHELAQAERVFLACLSVHSFKRSHGLKNGERWEPS